jgi:hypothetical protein
MHALTLDQLGTVVGGRYASESDDGTVVYSQTPYESCHDAIRTKAYQQYPDNRWFFQKWFGAKDDNADARADYIKQGLPAGCGMPK